MRISQSTVCVLVYCVYVLACVLSLTYSVCIYEGSMKSVRFCNTKLSISCSCEIDGHDDFLPMLVTVSSCFLSNWRISCGVTFRVLRLQHFSAYRWYILDACAYSPNRPHGRLPALNNNRNPHSLKQNHKSVREDDQRRPCTHIETWGEGRSGFGEEQEQPLSDFSIPRTQNNNAANVHTLTHTHTYPVHKRRDRYSRQNQTQIFGFNLTPVSQSDNFSSHECASINAGVPLPPPPGRPDSRTMLIRPCQRQCAVPCTTWMCPFRNHNTVKCQLRAPLLLQSSKRRCALVMCSLIRMPLWTERKEKWRGSNNVGPDLGHGKQFSLKAYSAYSNNHEDESSRGVLGKWHGIECDSWWHPWPVCLYPVKRARSSFS